MFRKLFKTDRPAPAEALPDAAIPAGQRLYAIGDIHGRDDLLAELLGRIDADNAGRAPSETSLIFLGDLIDRGPDSAQVVDRLIRLKAEHPRTRFLLGNHEEVFLQALRDGGIGALRYSLRIGGDATVMSYGLTDQEYKRTSFEELFRIVRERVPPAHLEFMEGFEDMIVIGDYAFVHAGVEPGTPLAQQKISDLRWIRNDFLDFRGTLEKIVVHGHSIADEVEVRPHRIGLDTGAYASGVLTAMGFEGGERWLVQTGT
ncbi:MAG: metallophosphoesterase family protein [Pseudomonadota bacterium]